MERRAGSLRVGADVEEQLQAEFVSGDLGASGIQFDLQQQRWCAMNWANSRSPRQLRLAARAGARSPNSPPSQATVAPPSLPK
jgi:hypothetical protein